MISLSTLSKLSIPKGTVLLIHEERAAMFSENNGIAVFDIATGKEISPVEDNDFVDYPDNNDLLEAAALAWNYIQDTKDGMQIDY